MKKITMQQLKKLIIKETKMLLENPDEIEKMKAELDARKSEISILEEVTKFLITIKSFKEKSELFHVINALSPDLDQVEETLEYIRNNPSGYIQQPKSEIDGDDEKSIRTVKPTVYKK